jgi:hypothetical protein
MTYAVVMASLHNVAYSGEVDYGDFAWKLNDVAGEEYLPLFGGTCLPPEEDGPFLSTGVSAKKRLVFEIDGQAANLELTFDGTPLQDNATQIVVNLGS